MRKLAFLSILFTLFNCTEDILDKSTCITSTTALANATTNFDDVTPENYEVQCNAYKLALRNQKESCGDESGEIQKILNKLSDCTEIN